MNCLNRTIRAAGLATLFGVGLWLCVGCGGPGEYEGRERAAVSGTVNFDGKPLPSGTVYFESTSEARDASAAIANGSYSIPEEQGPNLGKYSVRIVGYAKAPPAVAKSSGGGDEEEEEAEEEDEDEDTIDEFGPQIVPAKYNSATTLEVEIVSGQNTHNFDLTSQ